MKKLIIGSIAAASIIGGICFFSPTAKYAMKGNIKKIENAIQLRNAIEILEAKNIEMQEKYVNISSGIHEAERQSIKMQKLANQTKTKADSEMNRTKYEMYTNGVDKLNMALKKMYTVRNGMKTRIIKHRSQIEILKARLTYLESLKSLNSYLKDVNIDGEFATGINLIVETAIAEEEAVAESLSDLNSLKTEIENL